MQPLPWEDSSIDRIMLEHVLEHVPPPSRILLSDAHSTSVLRVIPGRSTDLEARRVHLLRDHTPVDAVIGWGH